MPHFRLFRALVSLALLAGAFVGRVVAADRPNIVVILADDLGLGDLSCYNSASAWRTPNLDRLARQGWRFTDAHSASGLCTPSRYALLTGRYAWRGALKRSVLFGYDASLIEPGRLTVAQLLRERGYATAVIGKWHLGLDWVRRGSEAHDVDFSRPFGGGPLAHGFDRFFGISASLDMPPYVWLRDDRVATPPTGGVEDSLPPKLWRAGPIAEDFRMEDVNRRLFDAAVEYIAERADAADRRPFFLYLPLAAPHTPILPRAPFAGSTPTEYGDFVAEVDGDVGRLLATLDRLQLAANTLVIFASDNGFAPPADVAAHRRIGHDPGMGLRGYKSDLYEGGHRIPLLVRWPAGISAGERCDEPVGLVDLLATCAELVGATLPDDAGEDSVSLLPLLDRERGRDFRRPPLVHHSGEGRFAIRDGRWKLLLWPGSGGWSAPTPRPSRWLDIAPTDLAGLPKYQLFDLETDRAEQVNVADRHPDIVQRLGRTLREYVLRGRSTPGPDRAEARAADWPELEWMPDFAGENSPQLR
jgi:Arylsulfatase A and related enzymes